MEGAPYLVVYLRPPLPLIGPWSGHIGQLSTVGRLRGQYDVSTWYIPGFDVKYAQASLVDGWKEETV